MVKDKYLAGVFDGEGCISLTIWNSEHPKLSLRVQMVMHTPLLVALFQARFGGSLTTTEKEDGKIRYTWTITGKNSKEALEVFSVLCQYKNREADLALEMIETITSGGRVPDWEIRQEIISRREKVRQELYQ